VSIIKVLLVLGVAGGSVYYVRQHGGLTALIHEKLEKKDTGFVDVPQPSNLDTTAVLVIAAENCPKEDAQRADRLYGDLRARGIRTTRLHAIVFERITDPDKAQNLNAVMNDRALPKVFVNGRAKANPTLDEVLKELGASK